MKAQFRIRIATVVLGATLATVPVSAMAVSEVAGATFPEQIVQEATSLQKLSTQAESYAEQIQQYATQLQQYENMVQNTLALPQATFDSIWNPLVGTIQKLQGVYVQAQALGYAGQNIGSQLAQEYPGAGASITNLSQNYANWNASTNDVMTDTLQAYGFSDQDFATEDQSMLTAQNSAATATGRAAIAGAAVAAANVTTKSIQQLTQITEDGSRAVLAYDKEKKAADNSDAAASDNSLFGGATNSILP